MDMSSVDFRARLIKSNLVLQRKLSGLLEWRSEAGINGAGGRGGWLGAWVGRFVRVPNVGRNSELAYLNKVR